MRSIGVCAIVLAGTLAAGISFAQGPAFDSATVKIADPDQRPAPGKRTSGGPGTGDPGHFYIANASMGELIDRAYGIKPDQLSAPCWILSVKRCSDEWVHFEVNATMPPDTTEERFQAMLRNLLETRFHLSFERRVRNVPGFELAVAEGGVSPEHPVAPPGDENWMGNTRAPVTSQLVGMSGDSERAKFRNRSIAEFVAALEPMVGLALGMDPEIAGRPRVTDRTGLSGRYTFNFGFACPCLETEGYQFPGGLSNDPLGAPLPNIFDALQTQIGLKLVKTADVPVDVIVVNKVDRTPAS